MNTKIIAVCNNKGGVGKTTTVAATAAALSLKGYRVLAVDFDPQANLSYSLSPSDYSAGATVADVLTKGAALPVFPLTDTLHLAPAAFTLSAAEAKVKSTKQLKEALAAVAAAYDYILIDTAPGVGLLTLNAISAATDVVVTLTAEALPTQGMQNIEAVVAEEGGKVAGYLITRYNSRLSLSKAVLEALQGRLKAKLFNTIIRENIALAEAPFSRSSIYSYSPRSNGAKDYAAFTDELVKRIEA